MSFLFSNETLKLSPRENPCVLHACSRAQLGVKWYRKISSSDVVYLEALWPLLHSVQAVNNVKRCETRNTKFHSLFLALELDYRSDKPPGIPVSLGNVGPTLHFLRCARTFLAFTMWQLHAQTYSNDSYLA